MDFSRIDAVRLYTAARPSPAAMGFFARIWRTPERPMRNRAATSCPRRYHEVIEVRPSLLCYQIPWSMP